MNDTMSKLCPHHCEELYASALSDDYLAACFYRSLTADEVAKLLGFNWNGNTGGLGIGYPNTLDGNGIPTYWRIKPDSPPLIDSKPAKYLTPKGGDVRAYIPRHTQAVLSDPTKELIITEGEKKTDAANCAGFDCIGLAGVWCFKKDDDLIPDLAQIVWKGRTVYIAFDSDVVHKSDVQRAMWALRCELVRRGATVKVVIFREDKDSVKIGLDDFLVQDFVSS